MQQIVARDAHFALGAPTWEGTYRLEGAAPYRRASSIREFVPAQSQPINTCLHCPLRLAGAGRCGADWDAVAILQYEL